MPRYYLTRLSIEGFRGINNESDPLNIAFKPGAVNSLFAPNGIGKSSIFEALCYAIYGSVPKLDVLQAQERPEDYYCNRFHSAGKASILVEFLPDDGTPAVTIRIDRDVAGNRIASSPSGEKDPEAFLMNLRQAFALLDYRTFARFIDQSPLERGRTFSSLLGLAEYSDCRQSLQSVADSRNINSELDIKVLTAQLTATQDVAKQGLIALRLSFEHLVGSPLEDTQKLSEYSSQVVAALAGVEMLKGQVAGQALENIDFDALKASIKTAEGGDKRREIEKVIESIVALELLDSQSFEQVASEQLSIRQLRTELDTLVEETRGDLYKRLYLAANEIFTSEAWSGEQSCPLCESSLSFSISDHVKSQMAQYAGVAIKIGEMKANWLASSWRSCLQKHEGEALLQIPLENRMCSKLDAAFSSGDATTESIEIAVAKTNALKADAISKLNTLRTRKVELEKDLPASLVQLTEQVEFGRQYKVALAAYSSSQVGAARLQARLAIRERWKGFINRATETFAAAETELSRSTIEDIDEDYKEMFREIMHVDDVIPELQRAGDREDLQVQLSEFHGQHKLSARALLSESYRNALAISVFLAAAIRHPGAPRFVVLDDVTSSFDAGHQFWLMELIRAKLQQPNNPDGLQFIVLSHDSLLEKYFDKLGSTADWNHNRLQGAPPMGAILHQAQGADRLKTTIGSLLSAGQVTQAEPLLRQYLEFKLLQVIRKVDVPVPIDFAIKDTAKMVSNCLDAITSAIELHRKAGTVVLTAQQLKDFESVHVPAIVGNWVSHYETGSSSGLSGPALMGVVSTIEGLSECFQYDDLSTIPSMRRWYRSLSKK